MCVVHVALLVIAKDFVSLGDGLELGFGFDSYVFGYLVGVVLQGELDKNMLEGSQCEREEGEDSRTFLYAFLISFALADFSTPRSSAEMTD